MLTPAAMHRICPVLAAVVVSVAIHGLLLLSFYGHKVKPGGASWPGAVSRLFISVHTTPPAAPHASHQRLLATRPQRPSPAHHAAQRPAKPQSTPAPGRASTLNTVSAHKKQPRTAHRSQRQQPSQETAITPTAHANSAAPTEHSISGQALLSELRASLSQPEAGTRLHRVARYGSTATGGVGEQYAEDWLRKAKHLGILNFPALAAQQNADDGPVLRVRLNADGSLHGITIVRHARNRRLDEAAIALVKMSTPFVPFPFALAERYDALDIVRKWSFVPSSSVG